ncbi:Periplasmic binding protein-like I [Moorella glycerini]|uniref:Uncharacterized protein n=1 Tax=Neomoorella stamsii TaxID=1266720 RepID=A0A9X7J5G8_9FIRM|nr:hypothetical protein MOST_09230 [Moorella stamsii]CEP67341.1 Periplasmic binding protein-like I [Moorella glycerini]
MQQAEIVASYTLEKLNLKKVGVLYNQANAYSVSLAKPFIDYMKSHGGQVVSEQMYKTGDKDFKTQLGISLGAVYALIAVGFAIIGYTLYPQLGQLVVKGFIASVIDGLGSLPGAVIGAFLLGIILLGPTGPARRRFLILSPALIRPIAARCCWRAGIGLIAALKAAGAASVGLISGGNTNPIVDWLVQTGSSILMADYGTDLEAYKAKSWTAGIVLRGSIQARVWRPVPKS